MGVTTGAGVHVDVVQLDRLEVSGRETSLLERLARGGDLGRLATVDVASGLDPYVEASMSVQHDPPRRDDERRGGHVMVVAPCGERITWPGQTIERRTD